MSDVRGYRVPGCNDDLAELVGPVVALSRLSDRRVCWLPVDLTEDDAAFKSVLEVL